MFKATSTIAKTKPKSYLFPVGFMGTKGGLHYIKMRFTYDGEFYAGTKENLDKKAEEIKARAFKRRYLVRFVKWYEKAPGTNYGRGKFKGVLVYTLSANQALTHSKVKEEWLHKIDAFWFG
jgi:hypothetical protein